MSGVSEIYIYCGAHTAEVEAYIESSKWHPNSSMSSPFAALEIVKTTARSVGDALRDLDARDLITGDFLLVNGDLVSNLPIDGALQRHRDRRAKDKNAIMTMILRDGGLGAHRTKSKGITPVFVIDPTKDRCLHYEEKNPLQANKYINIDPDLLKEHSEMEIRTDLIDCGIDICTPEVLALWAESFDYEVPRRHFLHGVLKDYELNGQTIHTEIVEEGYAARVKDLQAYESVSRDVLGRWTYPLVPDSNLVAGQTYRFERGGIIKENGVVLARTCKLGKRTVLGESTSIGEGSSVSNSIIGRRCQIGRNVVIKDSYIWDDVAVGDGTTITRSIIGNESVIGSNSTISAGALISFSVKISDSTTVKPGARITRAKRKREDTDPVVVADDKAVVGNGGSGYAFNEAEDLSDDENDDSTIFNNSLVYSTAHLNISQESISTLNSAISDDDLDGEGFSSQRERLSSFADSVASMDTDEANKQNKSSFHEEAVSGLLDSLKENRDMDSAKLEFMGLRLSNDANDHQIRKAIASAFIKRLIQLVTSTDPTEKVDASKACTKVFGMAGVKQFLTETAVGLGKKEADQVDFLGCLMKEVTGKEKVGADVRGNVMAAVCQRLYIDEICDEEGFLSWWEGSVEADGAQEGEGKEDVSEDVKKVREKVLVFIDWLREADEEDSEEESDDE